jgi:oxysterol-binding protein-related protein 8
MGNSGCSATEGVMRCTIPDFKETYIMTWPDVYFRGLIFGGLFMELNKTTTIKCEESKYECTINFKPKPLVGGECNEIEAKLKGPDGKISHIVTGKWDDILYIRKKSQTTKEKVVFLDTTKQTKLPKKIMKVEKQKEFESQVIWKDLTTAIRKGDIGGASKAKAEIEQNQREKRKKYESDGKLDYKPRFFKPSTKYEKEWEFIGNDDPEYLMVLGDLE